MIIGRDAEVANVSALLREGRLVTLTGFGGIGKTTLATAAAEAAAPRFAGGATLVDLTRVDDPDALYEALATQMGFPSFDAIVETPGYESLLLVIDNCEHLIDPAADAIARVIESCGMLAVLATSRAPLGLPGEVVVPVGPLEVGAPGGGAASPAIELFLARAGAAGVDVSQLDLDAVGSLIRRLDGVPLAIEIAAARTGTMTPTEIMGHLDRHLDVLTRPRFRGPDRHRSVRAAVDWSYRLLEPELQSFYERLAVFAGPFTAEMAHAVCAEPSADPLATLDGLAALAASSLLSTTHDGPVARHRMLESIRAHAADHLRQRGGWEAVHDRFVDEVTRRGVEIVQESLATWSSATVAHLMADYHNVTSALRWALDHDTDDGRACVLASLLWGVVHQAHTEEIHHLATRVLARWPSSTHPLRSDVLSTAATAAYVMGDLAGAIELATDGLADSESASVAPITHRRTLALARLAGGDRDGAIVLAQEASDEARSRGMLPWAWELDTFRAMLLGSEGVSLVEETLVAATAAGSDVIRLWAESVLAMMTVERDPSAAARHAERVLAESRVAGYPMGEFSALMTLSSVRLAADDRAGAAEVILTLIESLRSRGMLIELRPAFAVAAELLDRLGDPDAGSVAATARELPVNNLFAATVRIPALDGRALGVRAALELVRARLMSPQPAVGGHDARLRRQGDVWTVDFDGVTAQMRHSKGMSDLAWLLTSPDADLHVLDLAGRPAEGDAGEVIDARARRELEERLRSLQEDIDDAAELGDAPRADAARAELDQIAEHLASALGLGGRRRRTGGAAERARSAVTQRLRATIRTVAGVHPALGRHLDASIRTGMYCAYRPERPVEWHLTM